MNSPLLKNKNFAEPSVFNAAALIRESRQQKQLPVCSVPRFCVLDPDGDLSRHLENNGVPINDCWACYHTEMRNLALEQEDVGVVGCAVGSSFAVLVAEQLFASGCELLISVTSAGQLIATHPKPYFQLIDHALRDEGTSCHYLPASEYVWLPKGLKELADAILAQSHQLICGGSWTTDAPYRETKSAIAYATEAGLLSVEMEAAALYALAQAKGYNILCFAHITNEMATSENEFDKGQDNGNRAMIELIKTVVTVASQKRAES